MLLGQIGGVFQILCSQRENSIPMGKLADKPPIFPIPLYFPNPAHTRDGRQTGGDFHPRDLSGENDVTPSERLGILVFHKQTHPGAARLRST